MIKAREYPENIELIDFEEERKKRLNLHLITGGKEPPSTSGNWLKDLPVGTVFFVEDKSDPRSFSLGLFRLMSKAGDNDKLVCLRSPDLPNNIYVNPNKWCNRYNLYLNEGVLSLPEEQQQEETTEKIDGGDRVQE